MYTCKPLKYLIFALLLFSCSRKNWNPQVRIISDGIQEDVCQEVIIDSLRKRVTPRFKFIADSLNLECKYTSNYPSRYKHIGSFETAVFCDEKHQMLYDEKMSKIVRAYTDSTFILLSYGFPPEIKV